MFTLIKLIAASLFIFIIIAYVGLKLFEYFIDVYRRNKSCNEGNRQLILKIFAEDLKNQKNLILYSNLFIVDEYLTLDTFKYFFKDFDNISQNIYQYLETILATDDEMLVNVKKTKKIIQMVETDIISLSDLYIKDVVFKCELKRVIEEYSIYFNIYVNAVETENIKNTEKFLKIIIMFKNIYCYLQYYIYMQYLKEKKEEYGYKNPQI